MDLKLYNYISRKKEIFKPLKRGIVSLYTCGPTVYNYAHIGNLRTYIFEDILRRTLELNTYKVKQVMNITDVEDKIIRDARKKGLDINTFTRPFEKAFLKDLSILNIQKAWKYPRATEHIPDMIRIISSLLKKGIAYKSGGSVYYDISKFKPYGYLSRIGTRTLKAGTRVDIDDYAKNNVRDFVLWKAKKEGEPFWPSPFGDGRPGWHIECSAMSMKYLGKTLDIHAGAIDLLFPHHENEIAQSEGSTNMPFVRLFSEGEHLLVDGEKMAKSLGNTYTLKDIEAKGLHPIDFRYLVLTAHYRSKLNFTWQSLSGACKAREELSTFMETLTTEKKSLHNNKKADPYKSVRASFLMAVNDDLATPKALSIVWKFVKNYNTSPKKNPAHAFAIMLWFDQILGLGLLSQAKNKKTALPEKIRKLVEKRETSRQEKNWPEADRLREQIESLGWTIKDTSEGVRVYKQF